MRKRKFALDETAFSQQRVRFVGSSSVIQDLQLMVDYPDSFPSKSPRVSTPEEWQILKRHHTPTTREICTFGPNQRRWSARCFGTAAIDEADRVISDVLGLPSENSQISAGEFIDDVPEPATRSYLYQTQTYILISPIMMRFGRMMAENSSASFKLRFQDWSSVPQSKNGMGRGIITEISASKDTVSRIEPVYGAMVPSGFEIKGYVIRLPEAPPVLKSLDEFAAWLQNLPHDRRDWMAFVFPEQTGDAFNHRLTWLVVRTKHDGQVEPLHTFVIEDPGVNIRIPGLQALQKAKVALIGCGSMGSKIAANLAASGVEEFVLADFDYVEPDNAVRHEAGVELFGLRKIDAVEMRLIQLNPRAYRNVQKSDILIGGTNQIAQDRQLQAFIKGSSLIIESTGDHGVSRFMNDLCGEFKIPQLYATVTNGAWAGEVIRVIPEKTACWLCWNDQYYSSGPPSEPSPEQGIFAPGCDHPTFTGATYEIGVVAGLASSLAVDTILYEETQRKHFQGDYLRWQLRNAVGEFDPRIEVLPISTRATCRCAAR